MNNQSLDLVNAIVEDHRKALAVFDELESGTGSPQHRRDLIDHVITELVRHSVGEEQHVYPLARRVLPDGERVVEQDLKEHAEAEKVMKKLEGLDPTTAEFEEALTKLMTDIREHVADEEANLLPELQQHCEPAELAELGEKFVHAKSKAPTRPHPAAPDKPPTNMILAPGAGMIDRLRDGLSGRTS